MNMDYREPRNGDFASYVEELSRHFDMKAQTVNPDFTSRFPAQAGSETASKGKSVPVGHSPLTSTAVASPKGKSSRTGSQTSKKAAQSTEQSNRVSLSETGQQEVTAPSAATAERGTRGFPKWLVFGLIVAGIVIFLRTVGPHYGDMDAGESIGSLVLQIIIVIYLIKHIRQIAGFFSNLFSTSDKPRKQI